MVILDTTYTYIEQLLGKKISQTELEDVLFQLGFELDSVEDDQVKVEVTPDRIDTLSTHGLVRALRAFLLKKKVNYTAKKSEYMVMVDKSMKDVRPVTACAVVKKLKLTDDAIKELIWIQEKLHATLCKGRTKGAIGIYPMEKIAWPISFVAKKPIDIVFHPLEAAGDMTGKQILEEHETGKAYAHLLDGLKKYPLFVDKKGDVLSMPPIINSEKTGRVTESTTEIFIECSGFEQKMSDMLITLLSCVCQDMGGELYEVSVVYPDHTHVTPNFEKRKKTVTITEISALLGIDIAAKDAVVLLEKMQYDAKVLDTQTIEVGIPAYRSDVWHIVDIIDDIVRAYGVNNIDPTRIPVATEGALLFENKLQAQISQVLVGLGFCEVKTLATTATQDQFEKMGKSEGECITLSGAAEKSINMLRVSVVPELLKTLSYNRNAQMPIKLFELGDVVLADASVDVKARNEPRLGLCICQDGISFTTIRQSVDAVLSALGLESNYVAHKDASYIEGRCAQVMIGKTPVGIIGEIAPHVLVNWELAYPVVVCELDLVKVQELL